MTDGTRPTPCQRPDNNRYYRPRCQRSRGSWAEGDEVVDPTRVRLLDAAAAVFAEKGYDGAGVQEIARRAGLTTGAIYGRFTGKAELLREAIAHAHSTDELDELFDQHRFEGHASDICWSPAPTSSTAATPTVQRGDALLLEAFVAARRDPEIRDAVRALMDERADRLGAVLETAKADGSLDPDARHGVARPLLPRRGPRLPDLRRPRRRPA